MRNRWSGDNSRRCAYREPGVLRTGSMQSVKWTTEGMVKEIAWFCLSLVFHNVRHTLHAGNMIVFHRVVWPAAEPDTKQGGTAVRRTVLEWTEYFCSFRDFFYVIGNSVRIPYYTKGTTCRWCTLARRCSLSQTTALGARMCFAHSFFAQTAANQSKFCWQKYYLYYNV